MKKKNLSDFVFRVQKGGKKYKAKGKADGNYESKTWFSFPSVPFFLSWGLEEKETKHKANLLAQLIIIDCTRTAEGEEESSVGGEIRK